MDELKCPICGEPTYLVYGKNPRKDRLCKLHGAMKNQGLIEQCPDCGKWYKTDEICECKQEKKPEPKPEKQDKELTCIICGQPSNGKHFCHKCWELYSKKVVYLKIKNCKEFEKLEAEYESEFICDDGHMVKSPYEKIIDNWLFKEGIKHAYEVKIDIDKTRDLTPDFYIPEYNGKKDIYIEFWGYDATNIKYQKTKEYKQKIYPELVKRDNITVVYLTKKEVENDTYKKKIKYAEEGKINE